MLSALSPSLRFARPRSIGLPPHDQAVVKGKRGDRNPPEWGGWARRGGHGGAWCRGDRVPESIGELTGEPC